MNRELLGVSSLSKAIGQKPSRQTSNPQPSDPESGTLTTRPRTRPHLHLYSLYTNTIFFQTFCLFCLAGTEPGHSAGEKSHAKGYKLDIRLNDGVNSYIKKNYTDVGKRGDGAQQYKSPEGYVFAKEGDHWDILFP